MRIQTHMKGEKCAILAPFNVSWDTIILLLLESAMNELNMDKMRTFSNSSRLLADLLLQASLMTHPSTKRKRLIRN